MASKSFIKRIEKHIFDGAPAINDFVCATLWELGEATSQSFFSPMYSFSKPTRMLFGLDDNYEQKEINKNTIRKNLERLVKQGMVRKKNDAFFLSEEAKKLFEHIGLRRKAMSKKWDGKYRLIIFDIPEKKKDGRVWLRGELYLLGYVQLQKSVFIGKYPLIEDVIREVQKRRIDGFVNYLIVDKVHDCSKIEYWEKKNTISKKEKCDKC